MTTETRLEADSIGTMEVPAEAYYGVQALRAKQNFPITGTKLHPVFIRNLAGYFYTDILFSFTFRRFSLLRLLLQNTALHPSQVRLFRLFPL